MKEKLILIVTPLVKSLSGVIDSKKVEYNKESFKDYIVKKYSK